MGRGPSGAIAPIKGTQGNASPAWGKGTPGPNARGGPPRSPPALIRPAEVGNDRIRGSEREEWHVPAPSHLAAQDHAAEREQQPERGERERQRLLPRRAASEPVAVEAEGAQVHGQQRRREQGRSGSP